MATLRLITRKLISSSVNCDCKLLKINNVSLQKYSSYISKEYAQQLDPAPMFFNKEVQSMLKTLTRVDLNKVFRKRRLGEKRVPMPTYTFMSEDQLEEAKQDALKRADEMLQMPPVVKVRQPVDNVLFRDPALKGMDSSKFVITDISYGVKNSDRLVVVRELDGTLREADWALKDRMNQLYFPLEGRQITMPKMFEEENLKRLLEQSEFEFVLDRACLQFEPNDPDYQRVTSVTYQYVSDNNSFNSLRSTRHFGPLTFFLVWFKNADNLLLDLIETSRIEEAKELIKLYGKIHNVSFEQTEEVALCKEFISKHSLKKGPLELAVQAYMELEKENKDLDEGIKVAHGVKS